MKENPWLEMFQFYLEERNRQYISSNELSAGIASLTERIQSLERKRLERVEQDFRDRNILIVHSENKVRIVKTVADLPYFKVFYQVGIQWRLQQETEMITQEWMENRFCLMREEEGWWIVEDELVETEGSGLLDQPALVDPLEEAPFQADVERSPYQRAKAVSYAERWWNDYNPKFKKFEVDCTNYVSQCLWAGGAPMKFSADRAKGWWYRFEQPVNWSFSWAVAHSLRWYLPTSQSGLRAREVSSADQLQPGDVICYDFNGDGRWQHNTIVVKKDRRGMPLVNAHTTNSRNRYWEYKDSHAWTENIKYKFLHILD